MTISASEVESWLDANPDWIHDYFLRKADISWINKWLLSHGFQTVHEYLSTGTGHRGSLSQDSSGQTSPDPRSSTTDSGFFTDKDIGPTRHQRSNSKKFLRHDFAKSRMKSIFRTHEPSFSIEHQASLAERRSSLKGMRQFLSLPPTSGNILSMLIQSKVRLPRYASKDEEMKKELRTENEKDFFLEIVRDISHELDLRSLTSRILVNISILLDSDRSSLFFVEGPKGKQSLVSKVFDVYTGTSCYPTSKGDNIIRIPWGEGIIGYVAETGHPVNITDASEDPRYKDDVDKVIGYTTDSLLCMPIRNADDEIIAVVQAINCNRDLGFFTRDDEKILETYLAFCGLAISNAQAIESYTREYDRNKALLEVVHDLFEEQTSVESIVTKIMQRAQSLLKCERCVVMLKDNNSKESGEVEKPCFGRVFDLHHPMRNGQSNSPIQSPAPGNSPLLGRPNNIAEIVASTGETVNISDNPPPLGLLSPKDGDVVCFHAKSILCKPIRNNNFQTIGVAQLINKVDGAAFDEADDQLFEAFCIFCGLGINNCMLFDAVSRETAKQAVALEVLSYHASVSLEDVTAYKHKPVPECTAWNLHLRIFNDFSLNSDEMVLAGIRMFRDAGLIKRFKIDYETLIRWLLTVRKNYRNIAYHNWRHAFNVCQYMFMLLTTCSLRRHLSDKECLALIVACLCHDLDHRGTNNAFQQKACSPLATLYGTQATMEHHHFNHAVMILQNEGRNIFAHLTSSDYSQVMNYLKHAILATDLSLHIQVRAKFFPLIDSGLYSWDDKEQRELLRSILMTTCDIATITKQWEIQRRAADLVVTEFFDQGDKEKAMFKTPPVALMDRERQDELPRLQMEWIDGICLPLYKNLAKMDPVFVPMLDQVLDNRSHWAHLDQQRLQNTVDKEERPGGFKETDV